MIIDMSFLGTLGTLSIIFLFYILAKLSERLGSVQKMTAKYRYYYVALLLMAIAYVTQLLVVRAKYTPELLPGWLNSPIFILLAYHLPLVIGVSLGLGITWHYWSWLFIPKHNK